jgi:hypothetical protein
MNRMRWIMPRKIAPGQRLRKPRAAYKAAANKDFK